MLFGNVEAVVISFKLIRLMVNPDSKTSGVEIGTLWLRTLTSVRTENAARPLF